MFLRKTRGAKVKGPSRSGKVVSQRMLGHTLVSNAPYIELGPRTEWYDGTKDGRAKPDLDDRHLHLRLEPSGSSMLSISRQT